MSKEKHESNDLEYTDDKSDLEVTPTTSDQEFIDDEEYYDG